MAKFMMDEEKKKEYGNWIKSFRKALGMSQTDFAAKVIRFEWDKKTGKEVCKKFHRNSVKNWELGYNLPIDTSTVVSLALLEYDGKKFDVVPETEYSETGVHLDLSMPMRADRYKHMENRMSTYMGRRLYPRNINDALLIEVARGIYSFEELPLVRQKMNQLISDTYVSSYEKRELSLETVTLGLKGDLMLIENKRAFEELVVRWRKYFYVGGRTVGERMKYICERENPYTNKMSMKSAIGIYAPRYHDSYGKIFFSDISISRDWLLELCQKLRMKTKDIDMILNTAGMVTLTEAGGADAKGVYIWIQNRPLQDKFLYAALMAANFGYAWDCNNIPPMDYLYDYFWDNGGIELIQQIQEDILEDPDALEENPKEFLRQYADELYAAAFLWGREKKMDADSDIYRAYQKEFTPYYTFPIEKGKNILSQKDMDVMYFMAAFTYTLFTGKRFTGTFSPEAQDVLLKALGGKESVLYPIYLFMNNLWITFLGSQTVYMDKEKRAYLIIDGKEKRKFDMNSIIEDLCASWRLLSDI